MQGHSLPQFSDSDEYVAQEFVSLKLSVVGKNDKSMPFGRLPGKVLSWPIIRIERDFFANFIWRSDKKNGCVQEVF